MNIMRVMRVDCSRAIAPSPSLSLLFLLFFYLFFSSLLLIYWTVWSVVWIVSCAILQYLLSLDSFDTFHPLRVWKVQSSHNLSCKEVAEERKEKRKDGGRAEVGGERVRGYLLELMNYVCIKCWETFPRNIP